MKSLTKFYISWALSSWGDRLWYFALSMYFVVINQNSLLITAINGFAINLVLMLLSALIGKTIDKRQRITVIRISLVVQNVTVGLACILFVMLLRFHDYTKTAWNGSLFYIVQGFIILLNILGNLASTAMKISIERDWVIVVAKSDFYQDAKEIELKNLDSNSEKPNETNERLAKINAKLRGINLTANVIAPLIAGVIMSIFNISDSFNGTIMSAVSFAIWNFASCFLEYYLLRSVYDETPMLRKTIVKKSNKEYTSNPFKNLLTAWKVYYSQGILVLPGVAFGLLFLTVLGFDSITLGYAKSQKLSEAFIALLKGLGSITGIFATFAFQFLHNRLKIFLPFISLIGSVVQTGFLFFCAVALFLPGSTFLSGEYLPSDPDLNITCVETYGVNGSEFEQLFFVPSCNPYTSILVLLTAMSLSRFGLWLTDLATNQTMQESVNENERGVVGGVQNSINQLMDLIKFTLVIVLPDVSYYGYLVIGSVSATFLSFILYLIYSIHEKIESGSNRAPLSETGPFRKSMITVIRKDQNEFDEDSFDSFNEELALPSSPDTKIV